MRVIAGTYRGRELRAPRGRATRPTSDRVREALFSILADVSGARVLANEVDVTLRVISSGQPHRAAPLTVALCTAVAAAIEGTVVQQMTAHGRRGALRIGTPSGALTADREPAVKALFPAAELARISDAGHWVHAEQPEAFLALVRRFVDC